MPVELNERERRELRRKARVALLEALRALGGEARRAAVCERALADGGFTPRELKALPPESARAKHERMVDYVLAWTFTNLKRDGLVENPRWGVWRLAGAAAETVGPIAAPATADRMTALQRMPYQQYLSTPEWRRVRAAALERAGYACSLDVTHTSELQVHHRTYERRGCERPSDVVVLCRDCHELHHAAHGRPGSRFERSASAPPPVAVGATKVVPGEASRPGLFRRLFGS